MPETLLTGEVVRVGVEVYNVGQVPLNSLRISSSLGPHLLLDTVSYTNYCKFKMHVYYMHMCILHAHVYYMLMCILHAHVYVCMCMALYLLQPILRQIQYSFLKIAC